MTHTSNDPLRRSREAALREAREARDRAVSALIVGGVTGLGRLAAMIGLGLERAGRSIVTGVLTAWRRRTAIRDLQALDDRLLKDIGISRSDIPFLIGRQLSAERLATAGSGTACEVTAFPDRQATAASPRVPLRPAA